ncbi:MAG: hypothetical protein ABJA80_13710 [bacterium]
MRRPDLRRVVALFALAALGACGNEIDQSTRPINLVGTYQLVSYGGSALPVATRLDSASTLVSGELILSADMTWSETLMLQSTSQGAARTYTQVGSGGWTILRDYAYIAFTDRLNAYSFSGTASGGTVVLQSADGSEMIYRR